MKKKNKKIKEEKKKEGKFKSKWKTWMTVVVTIASVFAISGATVLGVYLAGGFDEKNIMPESIDFNYNDGLFNAQRGQLEVGEDFQLTITTPTQEVTRRKVELSFGGDVVIGYDPENKLISNGSIQVPQYVSIGRPFNVHLLNDHLKDENGNAIKDTNENYIDWIVGGISTLIARSENIHIGSASIKIAVDVPVYSTETLVYNSKGELTTQVVRNERFTVETKYIPADSKYMFSDNKSTIDSSLWREKHSYYEAESEENTVEAVYDGKHQVHFVASNQAADNIKINGYTFETAKAQLDYDALVGDIDGEYYYTGVLGYLRDNTDDSEDNKIVESSFKTISIGEENIGRFNVSSQTIKMNVETSLNLYLNNYPYQSNSDYLGVKVYSSSGLLLDNLLKNIVISFDNNGVDPTQGENKILSIIGDSEIPYVDIDGKRFYKSNSEVNDIRFSNWKLTATQAMDLKINVALLVNDGTELFASPSGEAMISQVNLKISKHEEKPLSWTDQDDLNVLLNYQIVDNESKIEAVTIDLNQFVSVPEENKYKDTVFFAWFGDGPLADYIETANRIIGENGYILERSGRYQVNASRTSTLFALNGSRITLYNTGEFAIYFATVKPNGANELYDIVEMSSTSKSVTSKTALYKNSISDYEIDATNFNDENENEISINLGSDLSFNLRFTIAPESVPVFKDEFQKGYVRPLIYDIAGNDISEYFTFGEGLILTDDEKNAVIVEYKVTTKSSIQIDSANGIYLGYISLIYDNNQDQAIEWKRETSLISEKLVNIYKPKAVNIEMSNKSEVYNAIADGNNNTITVDQSLTQNGGFNTTIKVTLLDGTIKTFNNVTEFINNVVGANGANFEITDQKGKTNTLRNQWKFAVSAGNSAIINFLTNGQSFAFRNTNSNSYIPLTLIIKSNDGESTLSENGKTFEIKFEVKATGISKIRYDSENPKTYETSVTTESTDTSKEVIVKKYGAVGNESQFIELKRLIELYCLDAAGNDVPFSLNSVNFKFTSQYLSETRLTDRQVLDLFGEGGMLTLFDNNDNEIIFTNTADTIRQSLANKLIGKIKINKNFANPHYMEFAMLDSSGAVNIMFSLQLLQNFAVSNDTYLGDNAVWAGQNLELKNTVTNFNQNAQGSSQINEIFDKNLSYYIVANNEGRYILSASETKPSGAIGEYNANANTIRFYDFWEVPTKNFTVYIQPEGANSFALNHPIQFEVKRDIKLTDKKGVFYIIGGGEVEIEDFVSVTRNDDKVIDGVQFTYDFADYIEYTDGKVVKKENSDFFFDYNQKSLFTTLTIKNGSIVFGEINVEIKVIEEDIYSLLASSFTLDSNDTKLKHLKPQSQMIGDINYIMFAGNAGKYWNFSNLAGYDYQILPTTRDFNGNSDLRTIYSVSEGQLTFQSKVEQNLLFGLNDEDSNENPFIILQIKSSGSTLATLHVPLLVSNIGYDIVVYENFDGDDRYRTENALSKPEELIKKGIYNEIEAGKLSQILSQYDMFEVMESQEETSSAIYQPIKKGGLYTIAGFEQQFKIYPLEKDYSNLVNSTFITKIYSSKAENEENEGISVGYLTLNHLNENIEEDVFIAFEYVVEYYGKTQTFYYVLKVKADVEVKDALYAYNGDSEYIFGDSSKVSQINLDALFDEKTLNKDKKRFSVNKIINLNSDASEGLDSKLQLSLSSDAKLMFTYNKKEIIKDYVYDINNNTLQIDLNDENLFNSEIKNENGSQIKIAIFSGDAIVSYQGEKVFETLKYKNEIISVEAGEDGVMTDSEQWSKTLEAYFSRDFSTLYYRPFGKYANSKMTIKILHTYQTTEEEKLSVVGGDQIYTLILNEDSEIYAVRFTDKGAAKETDEFNLTINNGQKYNLVEGKNVYSMQVELLKKEAGNVNTIVPNKLGIGISDGKDYIEKIEYNSSTGKLDIFLKDYIDSDKTISLSAYTTMGYLASINVQLKANITYNCKGDASFTGGTIQNLKNSISLEEGNTPITDYDIASVEITGEGKDLVKFDYQNQQLVISDLISDKKITISYVITLNDSQADSSREFRFSQEYILKQNVTPKASVVVSDETIAGTSHEISIYDLFEVNSDNSKLSNSTFEISSTSSNPAFNGININGDIVYINTNHISNKLTLTLTLKVALVFENVKQTFDINYSFVVAPSVKLNSNYPVPNSNGMMKFEYIDNSSTFENIIDFINANPIFGEKNRIEIYQGQIDTTDKIAKYTTKVSEIVDKNLTVILNRKTDNANIVLIGKDNTETNVPVNGQIALDKNVKFTRTSSGGDAEIELSITYQSVNIVYNIKLLEKSLSMQLNTVENFTSQGDYQGSSVNYEKIYVDKTNTKDMFAGERLVYAQINDSITDYADDVYYFVFSEGENDNTKLYASYPIYLSEKDQGGNLYYDLGISFKGKKFAGLYLASSIESNKIEIGEDRQLKNTTMLPQNLARNVLKFANGNYQVSLANRAQMIYGVDENGKDILVDFEKYEKIFGGDLFELETTTDSSLDIIKQKPFNLSYPKEDGSNAIAEFNFNYYYMASFDIDVKEKVSSLRNFVTIEVNDKKDSLNELLGIYHPTTNRKVTASDFTTPNSGLNFELIYFRSQTDLKNESEVTNILQDYMSRHDITAFKRFVEDDGNTPDSDATINEYMFVGPAKNANSNIYDYEPLPLGAKNTGDFVLGKITYNVGDFKKDFYAVIKIMPDYNVAFNGTHTNGQDEIGEDGKVIRSNLEPRRVEYLSSKDQNQYQDFALTGDGTGFMTISHRNGTSEKKDLSTSNFTISMPVDKTIDGITYNDRSNLKNKIFYNIGDTYNLSGNWTCDEVLNLYGYSQKSAIEFQNIKAVIFGNQNYFIEGEDAYGYRFRLYFMLKATQNTPEITNTITITEEDYIDLAIDKFKSLSFKKDSDVKYIITAEDRSIQSNDSKVNVLKFEGIDAWQFVDDYTKPQLNDENRQYLNFNNNTIEEPNKAYSANNSGTYQIEITQGEQYLNWPMINKLSVDSIKLYDPKSNIYLANVNQKGEKTSKQADSTETTKNSSWAFATEGTGYFGEPNKVRSLYGKKQNDDGTSYYQDELFVMPKLSDTSLYGNGDSALLRLVVRLKYFDINSGITEYCECPVNITVNRKAKLDQTEKRVVRDGEEFALSDKIQASITDDTQTIKVKSYVNDTIEVLVNAHGTATFDMTLTRAGEVIAKQSMSLSNTGSSIAITKYESLSAAFGTYVKPGDIVNISNKNDVKGIYYITNILPDTNETDTNNPDTIVEKHATKGVIENDQFTISTIEKDIVFVENAMLLNSYSYGITKHYIAQCEFTPKSSNIPTEASRAETATYDYRVSANYEVTGYVYNLERNYDGEIGTCIVSTYNENAEVGKKWTEAKFSNWSNAFKLYQGYTPSGGKIEVNRSEELILTDENVKKYLSFRLDDKGGETTLGNATIDTEDGTIQLSDNFRPNQFIRVVVLMKVSGEDRDITKIDNEGKVILGRLNLSTKIRIITTSPEQPNS